MRIDRRRTELAERHREALSAFEGHWNDPKSVLEFSKPSPQLLQLRATEHKLALINDFARAATVKANADALERRETVAAQARAQRAMESEVDRILRKQREEGRVLARWAEQQTNVVAAKQGIVLGRIARARTFAADEIMDFKGRARSDVGRISYRSAFGDKHALSCIAAPATRRRQIELQQDLGVAQLPVIKPDPAAAIYAAMKKSKAKAERETEASRKRKRKRIVVDGF
jgi:hypothetical protein